MTDGIKICPTSSIKSLFLWVYLGPPPHRPPFHSPKLKKNLAARISYLFMLPGHPPQRSRLRRADQKSKGQLMTGGIKIFATSSIGPPSSCGCISAPHPAVHRFEIRNSKLRRPHFPPFYAFRSPAPRIAVPSCRAKKSRPIDDGWDKNLRNFLFRTPLFLRVYLGPPHPTVRRPTVRN